MEWAFLASAIAALFAIIDPVAIVPGYLSITEGIPKDTKLLIIRRATITAALVLAIFGLLGQLIFSFLGFTIFAFRIAGGILLFTVGFKMLYGQRPGTRYHNANGTEDRKRVKEEEEAQEEIGVVPIGIPLIAGPGAITTIMIYMSEPGVGYLERALVLPIMLLIVAVAYVSMRYADPIFSRIGRMGALAVSRIMGLILAAIAVQFIIDGILGVARDNGLI